MNSGFLCAEITDLNLPEAVRALLDSFSGDLLRRCDNPGLSAAIAEVNRGRYHVTAMAGLRRGSWLAVKDAVRAAKNASGWDCKGAPARTASCLPNAPPQSLCSTTASRSSR